MKRETLKMMVYITKYALTKGIIYREVQLSSSDDMVSVQDERYPEYFHKGEYFQSEEEAIKKAEEMRSKKIQSLQKQIEKLQKLNFNEQQSTRRKAIDIR